MLLEIGYIGRAHGLRGEVVVQLVTTVEGRLAPGQALHCRGRLLVVEKARPLPGKVGPHGEQWLVAFAGVTTREEAAGLTGAALQAEPVADDSSLWVHELIGSEVVDTAGHHRGRVDAVEANPASDLLVLETGALVPLRFIVASEPGRVSVDVPPGLFEL